MTTAVPSRPGVIDRQVSTSHVWVAASAVRTSVIETSKKISLSLRFHGVRPDEDRAIMEFICKRQADRRDRGLA